MSQPSLAPQPARRGFRIISFLNLWVRKHLARGSSCLYKVPNQHRPESVRGLSPQQLYSLEGLLYPKVIPSQPNVRLTHPQTLSLPYLLEGVSVLEY